MGRRGLLHGADEAGRDVLAHRNPLPAIRCAGCNGVDVVVSGSYVVVLVAGNQRGCSRNQHNWSTKTQIISYKAHSFVCRIIKRKAGYVGQMPILLPKTLIFIC